MTSRSALDGLMLVVGLVEFTRMAFGLNGMDVCSNCQESHGSLASGDASAGEDEFERFIGRVPEN
jgi:hypothetical protein